MYIDENSTAAETLMSKLEDLQKYNNQIELGEDAKARKPQLLIEINGLCRELMDEEGLDGSND